MTSKTLLMALITGIVLAMLAALFTWFLHDTASSSDGFANLWVIINFPAFMGLMMTRATSLAAYLYFIFLQWFFIGFVGALVVRWISRSGKKVTQTGEIRIPPSERLR